MSDRLKFILAIGALIFFTVIGIFLQQSNQKAFQGTQNESSQAGTVKPKLPTKVKPEPQKESTIIIYNCQQGKNAFELLQATASGIQAKDFDFGKQIIAINGIQQTEGKYWLYTVNNQEATVSADNYLCQNNEEIRWELK